MRWLPAAQPAQLRLGGWQWTEVGVLQQLLRLSQVAQAGRGAAGAEFPSLFFLFTTDALRLAPNWRLLMAKQGNQLSFWRLHWSKDALRSYVGILPG